MQFIPALCLKNGNLTVETTAGEDTTFGKIIEVVEKPRILSLIQKS